MDHFFEKLKKRGFKLTPQRMAVAQYLSGNKNHPTAAQIFEDLKTQHPNLSMATVYNTLTTMVQLGVLREHKFHNAQVHFDPELSDHHHFCCRVCDAIWDIPQDEPLKVVQTFQKQTGHQIEHVSLMLQGVCEKCQALKH